MTDPLIAEARMEADQIREFWGNRKDCLNEARLIDALCDRLDNQAGTIERLLTLRDRYENTLIRIAAGARPDGSFNLDRETCRQIASEAINGKP